MDVASDGRFLLRRGSLPDLAPDLLVDIVTSACDLALVVAADHTVLSVLVNPLMGVGAKVAHWQGSHLRDLLTPDSWAKLSARLEGVDLGTRRPIIVELTHADDASFRFPINYAISRTAADGAILMVGRDLRPLAELQQQLVSAQLMLERDYEAHRELETRYRVVMEQSPQPLMIVSMSSGKIVDINAGTAELIGVPRAELIDAPVAQEFEGRRRGEFLESLAKLAGADASRALDLTVKRNKRRVTVSVEMFRAAGDRLLLCRLGIADAGRAQITELTDMMTRLYAKGIDAIVFLDGDGAVKNANEAFLNLTDCSSLAMVQGRSFADFLARGTIDLRMLLDTVKRVGHMRHFTTRLNTDYSGQVAVELSATWFQDKSAPCVGLVIRDASVAEATRWPVEVPGNDGLRNVMQLVGYSTLKDIVAETTEIIERMCIETALELTGNNRAAAAELLSLSRQSLYVKLRQFGLLSKDPAD